MSQSVVSHFGNIVYCIKGAEDKNSTTNTWADIKAGADGTLKDRKEFSQEDLVVEKCIGSGFEAATDEFVNAIHDDADGHGSGFGAATDDATTNTWSDIKETFVGSGFEAATDEFVSVVAVKEVVFPHDDSANDVLSNENIVSSGPDDTKSVINAELNDSSDTSTSEKVGNFDDSLGNTNKLLA